MLSPEVFQNFLWKPNTSGEGRARAGPRQAPALRLLGAGVRRFNSRRRVVCADALSASHGKTSSHTINSDLRLVSQKFMESECQQDLYATCLTPRYTERDTYSPEGR